MKIKSSFFLLAPFVNLHHQFRIKNSDQLREKNIEKTPNIRERLTLMTRNLQQ